MLLPGPSLYSEAVGVLNRITPPFLLDIIPVNVETFPVLVVQKGSYGIR